MPEKHKGLHEVRTRVTCNLPVNTEREERAFFKVLAYLNTLRYQEIGVSGYTHSIIRPAAFFGYWWPDKADEPIRDRIVICTVDYLLDFNDPRITEKVKELKQTIHRWYRHYKSPQDEVWVIAHPIIRQD